MKNKKMKDIFKDDRPYEKCQKYGATVLTDSELLAVIIKSGTKGYSAKDIAELILKESPLEKGILGINHLSIEELTRIKGIGIVKAIQIMCICELSKRIAKESRKSRLMFNNASSVADYYMEDLRHKEHEEVHLLLLDTKSMLIGHSLLSKGTVNASLISSRDILIEALQKKAVYMILVHNHPSGDPSPSKDDIINTKKINEASNLIGISLIDHIIIGDNKYISLKERGIL